MPVPGHGSAHYEALRGHLAVGAAGRDAADRVREEDDVVGLHDGGPRRRARVHQDEPRRHRACADARGERRARRPDLPLGEPHGPERDTLRGFGVGLPLLPRAVPEGVHRRAGEAGRPAAGQRTIGHRIGAGRRERSARVVDQQDRQESAAALPARAGDQKDVGVVSRVGRRHQHRAHPGQITTPHRVRPVASQERHGQVHFE
mmetsp:Transcript_74052/g.207870  ORF Transcript_74052/g.207870 Transcript_74052/m.207870 type:complete len:203 (+) Transcript_74052:819-1427(+)